MPKPGPEFLVYLNSDLIGRLVLASHDQNTVYQIDFSFDRSYPQLLPRPVLGQFFEDDLTRTYTNRMRAPAFFSNLLPEGPLRKLIAKRAGVSPERDFFLLAYLGEDLPGAVSILPATPLSVPPPEEEEPTRAGAPTPLRFSLAGVQLKFSMIRDGRSLTLPAEGRGGDWLVKLPDSRLEFVPENEYSMMSWAKAVGLQVPEIDLVSPAEIGGLPPEVGTLSGNAFAIRRFDRDKGDRVHIEDFAQVRGQYAAEKYDDANYETIGNIIWRLGGIDDLLEYVARLVFIIAIGNGDAHLKNWSLMYPDRVLGRLSPAYDLVSTIQYIERDELGLNLGGSKTFGAISLGNFERFARRLNVDAEPIVARVRATVEATLDSWSALRAELPIPDAFKARIDAHLKRVPLFHH